MQQGVRRRFLSSQRGMTLIEILVVVAIIGVVMGVVVTRVMKGRKDVILRTAKMKMADIVQQAELYELENQETPESIETMLSEGYLEKAQAKDPWGKEFRFESEGGAIVIYSDGPDKKEGTDDDIQYGGGEE